ncbi:MAG: acyltransferase [Meiothermus sp.]|nr:acyltransferase [Meiothermus sp.]
MAWLMSKSIPDAPQKALETWLGGLAERLSDASVNRNHLVRDELSRIVYARAYDELAEISPLNALALDPENATLEAEHYTATDPARFAQVKPLLWFWKTLDLTALGQSVHSGVAVRRALAPFIFKRVGRNPKFFQNVEFSVGYNLEVGDDVVVHRHCLLDDIGGLVIGDRASVSDYVDIYSHTHHVMASPDVTLKQTLIGADVRITTRSTVLAGVVVGDDAMIGTGALVTKDVPPHAIAMGRPAKVIKCKLRDNWPKPYFSETYVRLPDRKANPDYPVHIPPAYGTCGPEELERKKVK